MGTERANIHLPRLLQTAVGTNTHMCNHGESSVIDYFLFQVFHAFANIGMQENLLEHRAVNLLLCVHE